MNLHILFALLALIVFILDTFGVSARINLTALGLALLTAALLFV